jgi:hypothetical protein
MKVTPIFTASISPLSSRAEVFMEVYGSLTVPLISPSPIHLTGYRPALLVDVKALEDHVVDRLALYCAHHSHDRADVEREQLLIDGMFPVPFEEMTVSVDRAALDEVEQLVAAGGRPC